MLDLTGLGELTFSDKIAYISIEDAFEKFKYLWEYNPDWYVRDERTLSADQIQNYELALTVPKDSESFYIRVLSPFLIWHRNAEYYLINGNSRFYSMTHIYKQKKGVEFAEIPYQIIEGELTKELVERLQYDLNDTTRRNSAVEKLKRINVLLSNATASGMKMSKARAYICSYCGVSQQSVSNSITLFQKPIPENLEQFLDSGIITTDAAVKIVQAANTLKLEPENVVVAVMAHAKKGKITSSAVTNWRESYVADEANSDKTEVVLERRAAVEPEEEPPAFENMPMQLREFDPEPEEETPKQDNPDTNTPETEPQLDLSHFIQASDKTALLLRIAASVVATQGDNPEMRQAVQKMLVEITSGLSYEEKLKIQSAL